MHLSSSTAFNRTKTVEFFGNLSPFWRDEIFNRTNYITEINKHDNNAQITGSICGEKIKKRKHWKQFYKFET
jgi:hypothetical protein